MLRVLVVAFVLGGLIACGQDTGPTTPTVSAIRGATMSASGDRDDENENDENGRLHTDNVEAVITFTHLRGRFRTCQGEEGLYFHTDYTLTGTSIGDARLTGRIELKLQDIFNEVELHGPQKGRIVIRDAGGRRKAYGEYHGWGPLDVLQATIEGRVLDRGVGAEPTRGAGQLVANWRVLYHANGGVSAQIGGVATDNRLPAGIVGGQCRWGDWTAREMELPAPGAGLAAATATPRGRMIGIPQR